MKGIASTGAKTTFKVKRVLKLSKVASRFAPDVETLAIDYESIGVATAKVLLKVVSQAKPDEVLFERELTDDEKKNGKHSLQWDGKTTAGPLSGSWVDPAHSPYTLSLWLEDKEKASKSFKVEVAEITFTVVNAPKERLLMNDPAQKFEVSALVKLKKTDGTATVTPLPLKVAFSLKPGSNATKAKSFEYTAGSFLGKGADPAAIHWEAHATCTATSSDGFKQQCGVEVQTAGGASQGEAKVYFKPSAVGGDSFRIEGAILGADGSKKLFSEKSKELTVWRAIDYNLVYTMSGETYIDAATTHGEIAPAFERRAHVLYSRQPVVTLAAGLTVKYIGLYQSGGGTKNWPADFAPSVLETTPNDLDPTAAELADYAYSGSNAAKLSAKAVAKAAIEAKAQKWFNAIVRDYQTSVSDWFTDAALPAGNALLAVQYYHPKLSNVGTDGQSNFWPAGISINLANPGSGLSQPGHPDQATWREVQGFNQGTISVIFKNYGTKARLQIVCRHEIGHATKSAFPRKDFGTGDHSSSGLMTPYGGGNTFSSADVQILRGFK